MAAQQQFSRTRKHSSVALDPSGLTATLNSPNQLKFGKSVLLATSLAKDAPAVHQWSIRIDSDKDGLIAVGVAQGNTNVAKSIGRTEGPKAKATSWAYFSKPPPGKGRKGISAKRSRNVWRRYGVPFRAGDVVSCQLDTLRGTLRFFLNFEDLGVAFANLEGKALYPAVSLHRNGQRVTLLEEDVLPSPEAAPVAGAADAALQAAMKSIEDSARGVCSLAATLRGDVRRRFDAIRADLDRQEAKCQRKLELRRERLLLQLWKQRKALEAHAAARGAAVPRAAAGQDSPWPETWRSGEALASVKAAEAEEEEAAATEAEEEAAAGGPESDREGAEDEGPADDDDNNDSAAAEPAAPAPPPCHLTPVVSPKTCSLGEGIALATGLQLVPKQQLEALQSSSKVAEAAQKAAEKLRAQLAKSKAQAKQKELQTKRQNPLSPMDLVLADAAPEIRTFKGASGHEALSSTPPSHGVQRLLNNFSNYRLTLAEHVLQGWVEQRAPSCAAASVAGAFNSTRPAGCPAQDKQETDVLEYYRGHWRREVAGARASLVDLLGGADTAPLEEGLAAHGLASGTKPKVGRVLEVLAAIVQQAPGSADGESTELMQLSGMADAPAPCEDDSMEAEPDDEEDDDPQLPDGRPPVEPEVADFVPSPEHQPLWDALRLKLLKSPKRLATATQTWCIRAGALFKLTKERPSTGPVGTDRLMAAVKATGEGEDVSMQVWRLMGGAGTRRHQLQLSEKDGATTIEKHWNALVKLIQQPDTCVIYHLENHYSMVYGAREWTVDVGYAGLRTVRQILVARPGQRPCAWIDLETARNTMLRWAGYCMVGITALGMKAPTDEPCGGGAEGGSGSSSPVPADHRARPAAAAVGDSPQRRER